jgi:Rdx family
LEEGLGIKAQFVESSGEAFEVEYAGKLLFSKRHTGRFPNESEIQDLLKRTALFRDVGKRRGIDEDISQQ